MENYLTKGKNTLRNFQNKTLTEQTTENADVENVRLSNLLYLRRIILEANTCCDVYKISNDCAENLNRKNKAFLTINKKLIKALQLIDKIAQQI
jgi:hypothetical protein